MNAFQELTRITVDSLFKEWKENDDGSDDYPTFGEFVGRSNLLVDRNGLNMFLHGTLHCCRSEETAHSVIEGIIAELESLTPLITN